MVLNKRLFVKKQDKVNVKEDIICVIPFSDSSYYRTLILERLVQGEFYVDVTCFASA